MGSAGRVVAQYRVRVRDAVNVRLQAVSVKAGSVRVLRERIEGGDHREHGEHSNGDGSHSRIVGLFDLDDPVADGKGRHVLVRDTAPGRAGVAGAGRAGHVAAVFVGLQSARAGGAAAG